MQFSAESLAVRVPGADCSRFDTLLATPHPLLISDSMTSAHLNVYPVDYDAEIWLQSARLP